MGAAIDDLLWDAATIKVSDISLDKKTEVAKLSLAEELPGSGTAVLELKFSGVVNHEMAGFYRSAYKNVDGKDDWMFSTQFESCDARRAFPCFDEPNLKATYDFAITVPENLTALSNQPVKESKSLGNGLKTVSFLTVPKMSTYVCSCDCTIDFSILWLITFCSFWRGPAEISSMSKTSPTANMKEGENCQ